MKSIKITIGGIVQGVGYRYFCYKKAFEYNIKGYVKNLYNGNVEVVAQGDEGLIKDFINELKIGGRYSFVKSISTEEIDSNIKYLDFSIY
jgi:acylphosphatase